MSELNPEPSHALHLCAFMNQGGSMGILDISRCAETVQIPLKSIGLTPSWPYRLLLQALASTDEKVRGVLERWVQRAAGNNIAVLPVTCEDHILDREMVIIGVNTSFMKLTREAYILPSDTHHLAMLGEESLVVVDPKLKVISAYPAQNRSTSPDPGQFDNLVQNHRILLAPQVAQAFARASGVPLLTDNRPEGN